MLPEKQEQVGGGGGLGFNPENKAVPQPVDASVAAAKRKESTTSSEDSSSEPKKEDEE